MTRLWQWSSVSGVARCAEEKQRALVAGAESGIPVFVPSCSEDGGYKQIQCHQGEIAANTKLYWHHIIFFLIMWLDLFADSRLRYTRNLSSIPCQGLATAGVWMVRADQWPGHQCVTPGLCVSWWLVTRGGGGEASGDWGTHRDTRGRGPALR